MDNFLLVSTKRTPEVILISNGILMIKGSSHPIDVNVFYKPIFNWLALFKENITKEVSLTFDLNYVDTPSTRVLLDVIKTVAAFSSKKVKVKIVWKYDHDDHDMLDHGKIYETKAEFPFEFVEKKA